MVLKMNEFNRGDLVKIDSKRALPWRFREKYKNTPAVVINCCDNAIRVAFPTGEIKASLTKNWVLINPAEKDEIKDGNN